MFNCKTSFSTLVLFCVLTALPLYAGRRPDIPNSRNGLGSLSACPDTNATPFFVTLDGTQSPPAGCNKTNGDPDKPNPPALYPNRVVSLGGTGFTVTITPALWEQGNANPDASTKQTVFSVQFDGEAGMTLQSLMIGSKLVGAAYVQCDPNSPGRGIPFCINKTMQTENGDLNVLEPAAIDQADTTMTRWDFNQFQAGDDPLALVVTGFPSEFSTIDRFPNSNVMAASAFASSHFLAIVTDASNNILTAGGLALKTAALAKNDLFSNAINITKLPFTSFIDTSAANPQEILTGGAAGGESNPQGDPIPSDPPLANAGAPCSASWPAGTNRVFRSVWYKFTPATSGNYEIKALGSRYDTGVYVFTGSPFAPTTVACNDDAPVSGGVEYSLVDFAATAGTTYFFMVSEVPPPFGTDSDGPVAVPLATDATLKFGFHVGSGIVLSPNTNLNFPSQPQKTTSQPLTITATNTSFSSVTISGISIIGSGARDFAQTSNCVTTLAAGAHCTITITFTPLAQRQFTANLLVHVSGGLSPTQISLNGFGR
jgi:hypothetical protein